jgi:type I restriction enzyme, S subunit
VSRSNTPKGWGVAPLGDICVDKVEQCEPGNDAVPYIDIGFIDRGTKVIGELQPIVRANAPTRARQSVRAGDVLVSMTRPNLNAVALVPRHLDGAIASTGFDVLRPIEVLSEWVFLRVRSHDFVADVSKNLQGVVYPAIRPHDVRKHECPVPPLPEQQRIVEAIESYFTRLDDAVATLERVQRNLKRYRASILKAAVEGRLVPTEAELACAEDRDYEPASVLLERILAERRRR